MKEERKKRMTLLSIWTWTWVATLALATFGPEFIWAADSPLTIASIVINFLNGALMIWANRNLYNHYDELERKIHLEAMALTLGVAVIVGLTYSLLDQKNIIQSDAEIGVLVGIIGITYGVAMGINTKRYS
jgi:peptidoglycan/LPS O-acetylase OafA/YrhL